jgi:hypothetical protein
MSGVCCKPEVFAFDTPVTPSLLTGIAYFDGEVNLLHFLLLCSVGKGAFGKVPF